MFNPLGYRRYAGYFYLYLTATGIGLILFGILFIIWPDLLAVLVSFFFILLGLMSLGIAWRIKQFERGIRKKAESITSNIESSMQSIKDTFDRY